MGWLDDLLPAVVGWLYLAALAGLAVYGLLGLYTLLLFWRHRAALAPRPGDPPGRAMTWPMVTVQLPVYNERYVVERLIDAAVALEYAPGRVQILVLDDSADCTTELAARLVGQYQAQGVNIQLLHRPGRVGYKAGALAAALPATTGEFIAIFDADFQPPPDFLWQTIPAFLADRRLGVVQTRWGHLNDGESALTAAQAIALDKHFAVEQLVRSRARLFPKFNGTAGVWRRDCLEDAGGWQDDTVCEDLCLSTRAVLRGWEFQFLPQVVAPAELPASLGAYKQQQARWAMGSTQCLVKFGRAIWRSPQSLAARLYALLTMSAYATSLLLLLLLLLQLPLLYWQVRFSPWLVLLGLAGLAQPLLFVIGQQALYPRWGGRLRYLPAVLLVAVGMSVTIGGAVLQGLGRRRVVFWRTPKRGGQAVAPAGGGYRLSPGRGALLLESVLAAYAAGGLLLALSRGQYGPLFFFATCLLGFGYVAGQGLREWWAQR